MTTEQIKVSRVVLGETLKQESGMPTLEVSIDNTKGYLTPFRLYRFQISETFKGENDLAGSPLMEMKFQALTTAGITIMQTYAEYAVMDFTLKYAKNKTVALSYKEQLALLAFVKECAEWIKEQA